MDDDACNFDPGASVPNLNLCTYPPGLFLDCEGGCVNDADEDGVCDQFEIPGCTDPEAQNYNPQRTSITSAPLVGGCICLSHATMIQVPTSTFLEAVNLLHVAAWHHLTTAHILMPATLDRRGHANS